MEQIKQYEYVDLGLPSGLKWATMNVGATHGTDYGYYFQWGDVEDKSNSDCSWKTYKHCSDGIYKTFTNKQKNFFIEGGSAPITDETKFDSLTISDLISAYKAHDVELSEKSKGKEVAVESTATITKKQTSLI